MGASIQPDPKNSGHTKVEAEAGHGLRQRHAYSLLAMARVLIQSPHLDFFAALRVRRALWIAKKIAHVHEERERLVRRQQHAA